ncbi:MAG: VWA domain-containing protein [Polyangiaceae bacterium]|nr:VWA domain-containing protein [Polyangiaceae bacterium]
MVVSLGVALAACGAKSSKLGVDKPPPTLTATASSTSKAAPPPTATAAVLTGLEKPAEPAAQADIDVAVSRPVVAADKEEEIFVRVRVKGLPLVEKSRPPINISLVVDASGSMDGEGIKQARAACSTLVDSLSEGDALSIVTYGSKPKVIVSAVKITKETRASSKKAVEGIVADGTTDMAGGLKTGLDQLREHMKPDGINRIVLVGDGVPNDAASVLAIADQARAQRVPVTSLGLGPEFDETLMASIAQRSGGTFHFIEDASRVSKVFQDQIAKMNRLVARNTWVDITGGPGVTILETFGLPVVGRTGRIHIGDLTEGQVRDTIMRVKLKGHRDGTKVEVFDAVVHYNLPAGGNELTASKFTSVRSSANPDALKEANKDVEHEATTLRVADGIVRAIGLARGGDLNGARKLLDLTSKFAQEGSKRFEDTDLKGKVDEITKLKKTLHTLLPRPEPEFGMGGGAGIGRGPTKSAPRPAAAFHDATPAEAMSVRSTHSGAMKALQGD